MELVSRFFEPPQDHYFILGPRGTGKSVWTQQRYPNALLVNLLDPETLRSLSARPERLRELIAGQTGVTQVIVDEVQKLPELLEVVHGLIEEKLGFQFILTGSSARKLRRGGVNLLGGRAAQCSMHAFMAAELGDQFTLDMALQVGLLPVVWGAKNPVEMVRHTMDFICVRKFKQKGWSGISGDFPASWKRSAFHKLVC